MHATVQLGCMPSEGDAAALAAFVRRHPDSLAARKAGELLGVPVSLL